MRGRLVHHGLKADGILGGAFDDSAVMVFEAPPIPLAILPFAASWSHEFGAGGDGGVLRICSSVPMLAPSSESDLHCWQLTSHAWVQD